MVNIVGVEDVRYTHLVPQWDVHLFCVEGARYQWNRTEGAGIMILAGSGLEHV
jgi:hypothetical protein